jgi:surface polysaccharide O-acyltransferase-like enzyme
LKFESKLLFVSLGVAMRQNLIAPSVKNGVRLILLGVALSVAETLFLYAVFASPVSRHDFLIGTVPFGLGAAMVFIGTTIQTPRLAAAVRSVGAVSLGIYALHLMILWKVAGSLEPNSVASGLFTAGLTLAIAISGALIGARVPLLRRMFRR